MFDGDWPGAWRPVSNKLCSFSLFFFDTIRHSNMHSHAHIKHEHPATKKHKIKLGDPVREAERASTPGRPPASWPTHTSSFSHTTLIQSDVPSSLFLSQSITLPSALVSKRRSTAVVAVSSSCSSYRSACWQPHILFNALFLSNLATAPDTKVCCVAVQVSMMRRERENDGRGLGDREEGEGRGWGGGEQRRMSSS